MTPSKCILITGGAGFIGSHIAELLIERGFGVVVLDNESTGSRANLPSEVDFIKGDVRNPDDIAPAFERGIDAVFHIAGQASIRLSYMNPVADLEVNTLGTINILQACIQHRVSRLIFASSMTVYGNTEIVPTPEDTPADPASYYGVTKAAAERYVHLTAQRPDLDFPLHVTSMRMFNVYGPRQSLTNSYQGVLAIFIGNVLRGEPMTIHSDGEQTRDFVYVKDVARAWMDALDNPASYGQIFNLGAGRETSMNTLCDTVLHVLGKSRETYTIRYAPAQAGDMRRAAADISRVQSLLGWQPQYTLEQGLAATVEWAQKTS